jgi:hypothetical protein
MVDDIVQAFPGGWWGIAILVAAYIAGWQLAGWYKSSRWKP